MEVALAGPHVRLHLGDEFRCELEVEPHGEEIELEIELKWSASGAGRGRPYGKANT